MTSGKNLNAAAIIDRLCGIFTPIYAGWQDAVPDQTHLWAKTEGMSDLAVLERDVINIGRIFASADAIGARSEYTLLAECMAHLRMRGSSLPAQAMIENEIDKACTELTQLLQSTQGKATELTSPMAWRIAILLQSHTHDFPAPPAIEGLREAFFDLANLFVLRDGNITPEEDEQLKVYHATFNG